MLPGAHGVPPLVLVRFSMSENVLFPISIDAAFVPSQRAVASANDVAEPLPMSTAFVVTAIVPSGASSTRPKTPSLPVPNA